jgi:hypothetical protein
MRRLTFANRCSAALGSAMIGAIYGGLLASFGQVISSSTLMVVVTVVAGLTFGAWLGGCWGAINGAMFGGLATAFGAVVGGSLIGVFCTISACGLLGGWLRWRSSERGNDCVSLQQLPGVEHQTRQLQFACFVEEDNLWRGQAATTSLHDLPWSRELWSTIRL